DRVLDAWSGEIHDERASSAKRCVRQFGPDRLRLRESDDRLQHLLSVEFHVNGRPKLMNFDRQRGIESEHRRNLACRILWHSLEDAAQRLTDRPAFASGFFKDFFAIS